VTTGPGCDGVLTESDAHEVPCPHSETSRAARVSLTMRRIAPRRLSRLMNSRRTRRSAASLSAVPPSPLAEAAPSATRLMPMLVPSPNSTSSSRRRSVSGSVTCREATEVNSAVNPVTWSASLIRLSRSMMPHRRAISSFSAFRLVGSGWRGMCGTLIHGSPRRAAGQGAQQHPAADARLAALVGPPLDGGHRARVQADRARLVALAVHDAHGAAVGVDVGRAQRQGLADPQPRYSSVIRARFRMPVLEAAEHAAISASASARDRTSARYRLPLFAGTCREPIRAAWLRFGA